MGVAIEIDNVVKKYGDNTVINGLSLDINPGEFFTLLGPSGCGKTTLLRMIIGFNSIEGGDFYFGDTRINDMDPAKRNIGMVFQNYALYPHMTVFDNMAFGLKLRKVPKETIKRKVEEAARILDISHLLDRFLPQSQDQGGLSAVRSFAGAVLLFLGTEALLVEGDGGTAVGGGLQQHLRDAGTAGVLHAVLGPYAALGLE